MRTSNSGFWDLEELAFDETSHQRGLSNGGLSQKHQLELIDLGVHLSKIAEDCRANVRGSKEESGSALRL